MGNVTNRSDVTFITDQNILSSTITMVDAHVIKDSTLNEIHGNYVCLFLTGH